MRRSGGMRVLALVLALTVFFTSGFFVLFGDKVFGARNKDAAVSPSSPYVDENDISNTTVAIRGSGESGTITLTDEGSNVQGKAPGSRQPAWSPYWTLEQLKSSNSISMDEYNTLKAIIDPLGEDFMVPGTDDRKGDEDRKGSEGNPFVVLEVVPDKAMQELSYLSGSQESGLPFNIGGMSATMMEEARKSTGNSNLRFVVNPSEFSSDGIKDKISEVFGPWTTNDKYEVFKVGDNSFATGQTPLYSFDKSVGTTEKKGFFDINELYNFDVTTDDLLETDPVKKEIIKNQFGDIEIVIYHEDQISDYVKAVSLSMDGAAPMTEDARIEKFKKYLVDNVHFENRYVQSDKKLNEGGGKTIHSTAFIKYNITQPYLMANGIYPGNFKDIGDSTYDISWSRLGRSSAEPDGATNTYWRLLFRKYYLDHFEEMYGELIKYDTFWKYKISNGNIFVDEDWNKTPESFRQYLRSEYGEEIKNFKNSVNWNPSDDNALAEVLKNHGYDQNKQPNDWLSLRDETLEKLLKEYEPLFKDKGVDVAAIKDYMDWDVSQSDILSKARTYQTEPVGGYVLAVKPGMGDMYLITDKEKIISMGGSENDIVFARDKKAPTFYSKDGYYDDNGNWFENNGWGRQYHSAGDLKEKGDDEMRWLYVPSNYALQGVHPNPGRDNKFGSPYYLAGYLDDSNYTYGFASKSIKNLNDMWYAIYDRYNRKYHGGKTTFDNISKKMLLDTHYDTVWSIGGAAINDTEKMYNTYDNSGAYKTDSYHLNVLKEMFGYDTQPSSNTIIGKIQDDSDKSTGWTAIFGNNLNSKEGILKGENNINRKIGNILTHNDLIDKNGYSWFNFNGGNPVQLGKAATGDKKSVPWLYDEFNGEKIAASKYITGLCFNFNDIRMRTTDTKCEINRRPDIYNKAMLDDYGTSYAGSYFYHLYDYEMRPTYSTNNELLQKWHNYGWDDTEIAQMHPAYDKDSRYIETWHNYGRSDVDNYVTDLPLKDGLDPNPDERINKSSHVNSFWDHEITNNARDIERARFEEGDDVVLVDRDQVVTEKVKNYHFTYYGFGSNDILKQSLFNFTGSDAADKYKDFHYKVVCVTPVEMNAIAAIAKKVNQASTSVSGAILFDLAERADMFYFHSIKSRVYETQDTAPKFIKFYDDVVKREGEESTISDMVSFFENDLEWEQVMKIIKRSSNKKYGANLPIVFNGMVANMSVEAADPGDKNIESSANDTSMYLYDTEAAKIWNGNLNNISKMYLILIQFDLQAVKGSLINKDETDNSKKMRIERTFMKDIFPYLKQTKIPDSYDSDKSPKRLPGSAVYTGYVEEAEAPTATSWGRKLATSGGNSQFLRNALSLWNMYTFYPYGKKLENTRNAFIQQGYLASYFEGQDNIFEVSGAYRYRTGSDGMDGQNVYVYKVPGDNAGTHADTLFSDMGHSGADQSHFLSIVYNIMHNGGDPEDIEIDVLPRNQIYAALGKDSGNPPHSNVVFDYYKDTSMYDPADIENMRDDEKNLKIQAFNPNSEIGVITRIDVYKDNTFTSGSFLSEEDYVNSVGPASDYLAPITYTGEDLAEIRNSKNDGNLTVVDCSVAGNDQSRRGLKIGADGDKLIFHIPYKLGNYFDGYDRVRIVGNNWVRVKKKENGMMIDNVELRQFEHIINISEMDMFMLE